MSVPVVDLTIPVHSPSRPIERAVASVLQATDAPVRVTVVVHEMDEQVIARRLPTGDPRLRTIHLSDGLRSPAGPFNAGIAAAEAPWISIMGSDDTLAAHAIDSWLALATRTGSDIVIPRVRYVAGRAVPTPPTRPWRTTRLEGVRDRLSYRSAPLGIFSRTRFGGLRFPTGVPVGEDIPFVTALWFSGARIAYARRGPAYLGHADADDRTSEAPRPIRDEFSWLHVLVADESYRRLDPASRSAVVVKCIRIQLFGAVYHRSRAELWTPADRETLARTAEKLVSEGDGIHEVLSRADRRLLDAILDVTAPTQTLIDLAHARRRFFTPAALLPRRLSELFAREAPLRMSVATALQSL